MDGSPTISSASLKHCRNCRTNLHRGHTKGTCLPLPQRNDTQKGPQAKRCTEQGAVSFTYTAPPLYRPLQRYQTGPLDILAGPPFGPPRTEQTSQLLVPSQAPWPRNQPDTEERAPRKGEETPRLSSLSGSQNPGKMGEPC